MGRAIAREPEPKGMVLIERLTEEYAARHRALSDKIYELEKEIRVVKHRRLSAIKVAAGEAKDARAALNTVLLENVDLFVKPKSRTFHGITVGFRKKVGSLTWSDVTAVLKLIKKHFAEKKDLLIKTTEAPVKDALAQLSGDELKKLGISVEKDTDEVVIKTTDGEVEKLVDALLKEEEG